MIPDKKTLEATARRIEPYIHRTPVLTSSMINNIVEASLYFKCDNFQKAGAYKIRGATNAILQLSEFKRAKGVATHSSGNFAQALSLAASKLQIPAFIVMPENAPIVKIEAVKGYGGQVILCPSTLADRESTLAEVIKEKGATPIHPSNDIDVICGQATMSMELIEEIQYFSNRWRRCWRGGVSCMSSFF